jgi:hypothetical protein
VGAKLLVFDPPQLTERSPKGRFSYFLPNLKTNALVPHMNAKVRSPYIATSTVTSIPAAFAKNRERSCARERLQRGEDDVSPQKEHDAESHER